MKPDLTRVLGFARARPEDDGERIEVGRQPSVAGPWAAAAACRSHSVTVGKIRSTINNAQRAIELAAEFGSLAAYFWRHSEFGRPPAGIVPTSPASIALAKDLERRGWSFVGPTTVYAFMQAVGLVNDHVEACWVRERAEKTRRRAARAAT